jgi:hypothetical protein
VFERNGLAFTRATDWRTSVGVQVRERLHREWRPDADLGLDAVLQVLVAELLHAAVAVVDHRHLAGAEQPLGDHQRSDHVLGDRPAGVADHVRVA